MCDTNRIFEGADVWDLLLFVKSAPASTRSSEGDKLAVTNVLPEVASINAMKPMGRKDFCCYYS